MMNIEIVKINNRLYSVYKIGTDSFVGEIHNNRFGVYFEAGVDFTEFYIEDIELILAKMKELQSEVK